MAFACLKNDKYRNDLITWLKESVRSSLSLSRSLPFRSHERPFRFIDRVVLSSPQIRCLDPIIVVASEVPDIRIHYLFNTTQCEQIYTRENRKKKKPQRT